MVAAARTCLLLSLSSFARSLLPVGSFSHILTQNGCHFGDIFARFLGRAFESLGAEVSITWALHITNGAPTRGVPRGRAGGTIFARHDRRFIGLQWSVAALRLPEIGTGPDPGWVTPSGTRKLAPSLGCTRQDDPNPDFIPFDYRICLLTRSWYNAAILEV